MARSAALEAKKISVDDAKKVGNWIYPDTNYDLVKANKEIIYGATLKAVEIKDNKSGNNISLLELPRNFGSEYMIKNYGSVKNSDYLFLEKYIINNYKEKGSERIILGDTEVYYSLIETESYKLTEEKVEGIGGRMGCAGAGNSVTFLIVNNVGKYDNERALEFLKTLSCSAREGGKKIKAVRTDLDQDGVPDIVEDGIRTSDSRRDTDSDGYSDLDEIESGYSPTIAGSAGKLSTEAFEIMKEKIKSADAEFYNQIF